MFLVIHLTCSSLLQGRKAGGITEHKAVYAKDHPDITSLEEVCETIKPSVAIGKTFLSLFFRIYCQVSSSEISCN